jgi:hypothetical protein
VRGLFVIVIGCSGSNDVQTPLDPNVAPVDDGTWFRPTPPTTWQWQLQGTLNTSYDVDVYDVDLLNTDPAIITSLPRALCYFSAGSFEDFRPIDVPEAARGKRLDGFPDERWLDIRSPEVHRAVRERLDLAVMKGCDGVEPDNVDGFLNDTWFDLTAEDQLAFNRFLANEAHARNLTVALKNDLDQIPELVAYFDLALDEQCHEFDECSLLEPFVAADKAVFIAEYDDRFVNDQNARDAICAASISKSFRTLILPLDLDDSFRFSCDP